MRVCMVTLQFPPNKVQGQVGGISIHTYELAKRLSPKVELHIITSAYPNLSKLEKENNYIIHRLKHFPPNIIGNSGLLDISFSKAVKNQINKLRPDLVHIHEPHLTFFPISYPLISTSHGIYIDEIKFSAHLTKIGCLVRIPLEFIGLHRSDWVTTVSEYMKKELTRHYSIKNISVIPNGVDLEILNPSKIDGSSIVEKYGPNLVLYVGRFSKGKGITTLLKSAKLLPDVTFLLVGAGLRWKGYVNSVRKLNNVKCIGFMPFNRLVEYYAASDVFVHPSLHEAFGLTVLEAMAMEKPIIASNIGGIPEVLGTTGLLFTPSDYIDLSKKIKKLLNDREFANALSKRARKRALNFDWSITAEKTLQLYENILEGKEHI
ncbi:MAG: hypothetical protein AM326_00110 [Candidatus Thorarchaeota archaeon SMTZ-45]|nr:MAG: hypothetical protein AM326_00110 [Candidatus Thorarchaeota archaeon SMTZ-45]